MKSQHEMHDKVTVRRILSDELERRCNQNPRYSLRAFAKALSMSPAMLSLVISGHRELSKSSIKSIEKKLGLDPIMTSQFIMATIDGGLPLKSLTGEGAIDLDNFKTIADWYHFGILSLIETKGFKPEIPWIAARLGISIAEARSAVERMTRLGILDTSSLKWKQIGSPIFLNNDKSTAATRKHQSQVLKKAVHSLENDNMEVREHNSVTLAMDPKHMPYARTEIKKFLKRLMTKLESTDQAQEVYTLSIQIFPVSKKSTDKIMEVL